MVNLAPELRVQVAEQADYFRMPRPPEVHGQRTKALMEMVDRTFHSLVSLFSLSDGTR
jgi:hypothetical protein